MILLDTQALLWLVFGEPHLGPLASQSAQEAGANAAISVSAANFWEVAMLVRKGRMELYRPASLWRRQVISLGIEGIAVSGEIGITAVELTNFHRDPGDRIITATAMVRGATLLTADEQILAWPGPLARQDARR